MYSLKTRLPSKNSIISLTEKVNSYFSEKACACQGGVFRSRRLRRLRIGAQDFFGISTRTSPTFLVIFWLSK